MATIGGFYLNPHRSQFDGSTYENANCVPTTVGNGANAVTRGAINHSGGWVRGLIPRSQETDPSTVGWSIPDAVRAAAKMGLSLVNWTGKGWAALRNALDAGHYVLLQGDSDQFSNATCSGAFNGGHAVGIHPARRVVNGSTQHWIDDPICKTGRWEYDYVLIRYANKLASNIRYAVFTRLVSKATVAPKPSPTVTLRYGAVKIAPVTKRIDVPAGKRANVRYRPNTSSPVMSTIPDGGTYKVYQRTTKGQVLAGSGVWYGNAAGTRWLHISSF